MSMFNVLVDYAYSDKPRRCPYALVMTAHHGDGISVFRCELNDKHDEAHKSAEGYQYEQHYVSIKIEWEYVAITENSFTDR